MARNNTQRTFGVTSSILTIALFCSMAVCQGQDGVPEKLPANRCVVELLIPDGATVKVRGKSYGKQRAFPYSLPKSDVTYRDTYQITLPDGRRFERAVILRGGQRVRIELPVGEAPWNAATTPQPGPADITPPARAANSPAGGATDESAPALPQLVLQIGHRKSISCAAFSRDGRYVVTGSFDQRLILWNTETGLSIRTFRGHKSAINCVAFGAEGSRILSGSVDGQVILWDIRTGAALRELQALDATAVLPVFGVNSFSRISYSEDGTRFVTVSQDEIVVRRTGTGQELYRLPRLGSWLCFSADGNRIASSLKARLGEDGKFHFQNTGDRQARNAIPGKEQTTAVVWDFAEGQTRYLGWHAADITKARLNASGTSLVAASRDGVVLFSNLMANKRKRLGDKHGSVAGVAISADGRKVLIVSFEAAGGALNPDASSDTSTATAAELPRAAKIRLWETDTGELLREFDVDHVRLVDGREFAAGNLQTFKSAGFTADGRTVYVATATGIYAWATEDGQPRFSWQTYDFLQEVVPHPNAARLLAVGSNAVVLLDAHSGEPLHSFEGNQRTLEDICFARGGQRILTLSARKGRVWDTVSGTILHTVGQAAGKEKERLQEELEFMQLFAESKFNRKMSPELEKYLRERQMGQHMIELLRMMITRGPAMPLVEAHVVKDKRKLFAAFGTLHRASFLGEELTDLRIAQTLRKAGVPEESLSRAVSQFRRMEQLQRGSVAKAASTPDGHRVVVAAEPRPLMSSAFFRPGMGEMKKSGYVSVWDAEEGRMIRQFESQPFISCVAISPDGSRVLVGAHDTPVASPLAPSDPSHTIEVREVSTGRVLVRGRMRQGPVLSACFNRDNSQFFVGLPARGLMAARPDGQEDFDDPNIQQKAIVYDVKTGQPRSQFGVPHGALCSAFHPSQDEILVGTPLGALLWDLAGNRRLRVYRLATQGVPRISVSARHVAFGPRGNLVLTAGWNSAGASKIILWETYTGRAVHRKLAADTVVSAGFSEDGRSFFCGFDNATTKLWDVESGKEVARLILLEQKNEWLAVTPEGLFDGSAQARQKLRFRVGRDSKLVPVDRFFQDFYYPGLFALCWLGERPTPKVELGTSRPPSVRIVSAEDPEDVPGNQIEIVVEAVDAGDGVRGPWLKHNGALAVVPGTSRRTGRNVVRTFVVSLVKGQNRLEFHASSADGAQESEPAVKLIRYDEPLPKPNLFLVTAAVGDYGEESMRLKFPIGDARALIELFRARGGELYDNVRAMAAEDETATGDAILTAIRGLAEECRPQDAVMVFLTGHGAMVRQRYYFLPHGVETGRDQGWEKLVRDRGLAVTDVGEAMSTLPALKRVLVLDTGQSGATLQERLTARGPFAFRGAIERLGRAQGAFAIAALPVSSSGREVSDLSHGVLTYTLLAGLRAVRHGPLAEDWLLPQSHTGTADVLQWFGYASPRVYRLTQAYFDAPNDVQYSTIGMSFPILPVPAEGDPPKPPSGPRQVDEVPVVTNPPAVRRSPASQYFVVAVGISRYADESMNLRFAAADAQAIADLFERRAGQVCSDVNVRQLLNERARRTDILQALDDVSEVAKRDDRLCVFLSGHGMTIGQRYYFIPHDFARETVTLEEGIRRQGIPADELAEALAKIPAKHRILVLDTCASGGALGIARQGQNPYSFRGAIEKLGQTEGVFTIAAAAAGEEAQEIPDLGHGVLTYTLLAGLDSVQPDGPLYGVTIQSSTSDGCADVLDWFSYASGHVARLSKRYLGNEQDVQIGGSGRSFAVLPVRD